MEGGGREGGGRVEGGETIVIVGIKQVQTSTITTYY